MTVRVVRISGRVAYVGTPSLNVGKRTLAEVQMVVVVVA